MGLSFIHRSPSLQVYGLIESITNYISGAMIRMKLSVEQINLIRRNPEVKALFRCDLVITEDWDRSGQYPSDYPDGERM